MVDAVPAQSPGGHTLTTGGVTVKLLFGSITDQKTDVIVNVAPPSLDLDNGVISKAVLAAAGSDIQQECKDKYPSGQRFGEFAVTTGGDLPCNVICHGAVDSWRNGAGKQYLHQLMKSVLDWCEGQGHGSVAFPAIGTGQLGFPKDVSAQVMYEEIGNFSNSTSGVNRNLKKVVIVVYDKDEETKKAFVAHASGSSRTPSATVNPVAPQNPSLPVTLQIGSVQLTVKQNDITKEQVAVLVNSAGNEMKLNDGSLSRAILNAAGAVIQTECDNNKPAGLKHGDIVETSGGKLRVKVIYHGSLPEWNGGQGEQVLSDFLCSCMEKANADGHTSIAIPSIGTGVLKFPHKDVARIVHGAVTRSSNLTSLVDVRLVVMDSMSVKEFSTYFNNQKSTRPKTAQQPKPVSPQASKTQQKPQKLSGKQMIFTDTFPSLTLQVYTGIIENEQVDVIVNVVDTNCDVTHGNITKAIVGAAGSSVTDEMKKSRPNGALPGEIVVTSGGNLNCQKIYHGVVPKYDQTTGNKALHTLVMEVLQLAHSDHQQTVSLPCVGSGKMLQYPPDVVAVNMVGAVQLFANQKATSVKHVNIVLHRADSTSIKAFTDISKSKGDLPGTWSLMRKSERYQLFDVLKGTAEYGEVAKRFNATASEEIIWIERVQNLSMHRSYEVNKSKVESFIKNKAKFPTERRLYHGTKKDVLPQINSNGFNRSYSGDNVGALYGNGTYFAVNAEYSTNANYSPPDSIGNRYMYECKVLTGEFTAGCKGMKVAPEKDKIEHLLYDSVVNDVNDPAIYVIFPDGHAYPEYLITFK